MEDLYDGSYNFWLKDIYYIRTSIEDKESKLNNDAMKKFFLATLYYYKFIYHYKIYGYAVLDHMVHFIIQMEGQYPISKVIQQLKGCFAREYNKINHKEGSFWEHGYHSIEIHTIQQLAQELNHIHFSPLKMDGVYHISEFPFSSLEHYLGKQKDHLIDDFVIKDKYCKVLQNKSI